jgi:Family of unknown function (DUF6069)
MPALETTTATTLARGRSRAAVVLAAGAIVAVAANAVIAMSALAAGANSAFSPLLVFVYGPFTVVGLLAAYAGWRIVRSRARSPRRVLLVLVPVLTVLSFVPDTFLALRGFIPGTSLTGVIALMLMHLVVVGVAVPLSARLAPVR